MPLDSGEETFLTLDFINELNNWGKIVRNLLQSQKMRLLTLFFKGCKQTDFCCVLFQGSREKNTTLHFVDGRL
jgi:hypothetical protein